MKHVEAYRDELVVTMAEQGFTLSPEDSLVLIYIHRYVVCTSDPASSVVYRSTMATTRSSTETRYENTWKGVSEGAEATTDGNAHPGGPSRP